MIKNFFLKGMLVFLSVLITLVFLDIILLQTNFRYVIMRYNQPQYYYENDIELGLDIVENAPIMKHGFQGLEYDVWSNNLRCFDTQYDGRHRDIYITGDSFTWGYAPFEDKWGTQIELLTGVKTFKCGVAGFGTRQQYIKTQRHLDVIPKPDLLIVGYLGSNDVYDDYGFPSDSVWKGYRVGNFSNLADNEEDLEKLYKNSEKYCINFYPENPTIQRVKCFLFQNSVIYNLSKEKVKALIDLASPGNNIFIAKKEKQFIEKGFENNPLELPDFHKNALEDFIDLSTKKNIPLLFVLIPGVDDIDGDYTRPDWNTLVQNFFEENDILVFDLQPYFIKVLELNSDLQLYWPKDGHWNIEGNRLAGLLVSKYLIENNLVETEHFEKINEINQALLLEFNLSTTTVSIF